MHQTVYMQANQPLRYPVMLFIIFMHFICQPLRRYSHDLCLFLVLKLSVRLVAKCWNTLVESLFLKRSNSVRCTVTQ